jgi:hypothetical protein
VSNKKVMAASSIGAKTVFNASCKIVDVTLQIILLDIIYRLKFKIRNKINNKIGGYCRRCVIIRKSTSSSTLKRELNGSV